MGEQDKNIIPLFPLPIVLFPTSSIKLHIFEEKYKKMINDCIALNSVFGICLKENIKIHNIGCTAAISHVEKYYPGGEKDIIIKGKNRFNIKRIYDAEKPYLSAEIELLNDIESKTEDEFCGHTLSLYNELVKLVYVGSVDIDKTVKTLPFLSYHLAEKIGMTLPQRQLLLETSSESLRMEMIHDYLVEIIPKIREFDSVQAIIHNDGYL